MNIKHLEVKQAYYADPENVVIQYRHSAFDDWTDVVREPKWTGEGEYRIKPKTLRIGDLDVPEPVREPLNVGTTYYTPDLGFEDGHAMFSWQGDIMDTGLLKRNLIHLTLDAAKLHYKALVLVSGGKVDE